MPSLDEILGKYRPYIKDAIEKCVPRAFTDEYLLSACGPASFSHLPESLTKAISVPAYDLFDRGGKRMLPSLFLLVAEALGKSVEEVADLSVISEIIHTGTLIIDDIEDNSTHRRGKPCTHILFGNDLSINAGNMLYYLPLVVFKQYKEKGLLPDSVMLKLYETYSKEMINIHLGQGYDIWWHSGKSTEDIKVENYLQMCAYKTGTLTRLSGLLAAYAANVPESTAQVVGKFCEAVGVCFQIQDDILCVVGEKFSVGKGGIGEDIREGKRTLMVIHAMQHTDKEKANRLIEILNKHTTDQNEVLEAIEILKNAGSVDYARKFAQDLLRNAWEAVRSVLPESSASASLHAFAEYLIHRDI